MVEHNDLQVGLFLWHSYFNSDDEKVCYPIEITEVSETGFVYTNLKDFQTGLVVEFEDTSLFSCFFQPENFFPCSKEEVLDFLAKELEKKRAEIKKVESNLQALHQSEDNIRLFVTSHPR